MLSHSNSTGKSPSKLIVNYTPKWLYYNNMKKLLKSHHPLRHAKSFKYAFNGVWHALVNEPNFRVEIVIATFFISVGVVLHYSLTHWATLVLGIGLLLCTEIINTVIEEFVDLLIKEYHESVRVIKDMSAAFVLTAAFTVLIVFILISLEYVFR